MSLDKCIDALFLVDARDDEPVLQRGPEWLRVLVEFYEWWLKK